jgi:hypothetical protein
MFYCDKSRSSVRAQTFQDSLKYHKRRTAINASGANLSFKKNQGCCNSKLRFYISNKLTGHSSGLFLPFFYNTFRTMGDNTVAVK